MDVDEIKDELSIFGISFENDNAINALRIFLKRHHRAEDETLDSLVAYATNNSRTVLSEAFISEFIDVEASSIVSRQENTPPKPEVFSPVKKEILDFDDQDMNFTPEVAHFTQSQTSKCIINVKIIIDEAAKEERFRLLPYGFKSNDDMEDDLHEILGAGDDVTMSGFIVAKRDKVSNEIEKCRMLSKKYGNLEVDLNKVSQEYIFDNMYITCEANLEGNKLKIRNIVPPAPPTNAAITRPSLKMLKDFASIMVACGPFKAENSFRRIFNHAIENDVKLLILFGPLPCFENKRNQTVDDAFDNILKEIYELAGERMDVVIVPPTENDPFVLYPTYPTTHYYSERFSSQFLQSKRVYLLDNPSVFSFDGMHVAVANFDTMRALSRGSLVTAAVLPENDRMNWYVQQMLQYGNICPSYSCSSTLKNNKFITNPTLFISPSKFRSFSAGIEDVVFVNICSTRGNANAIIKPQIVDTNGEEAKLEFTSSFYA